MCCLSRNEISFIVDYLATNKLCKPCKHFLSLIHLYFACDATTNVTTAMISVNFYINFIVFYFVSFCSAALFSIVSGAIQIHFVIVIVID